MFKRSEAEARKRRIEKRIEEAQRPGHEQNYTQKAMLACFAGVDPKYDIACRNELKAITDAINQAGKWEKVEEWRISTSFKSQIEKTQRSGNDWYLATVSCDGQVLSCGCPTVERAFAFVQWYQHMIVYQFLSVGPPWGSIPPFEQ
jgi:hypothetical protein